MRKYAPLFLAAFVMLTGAGCAGMFGTTSTTTVSVPAAPSGEVNGRAVFMLKDAASSLQGVTSVMLTVDKVEAHSTSTGWVTVLSSAKQYDLLQLKNTGSAQLLADANLAAGTYDQIRLDISQVMVTASGTTQEAKLPSNTLKIVGQLVIVVGETSTASLDFQLDKSLHLTGNGKYILAPVVRLQTTENASVNVQSDESVSASGGTVDTDENEGMDQNGETKTDFVLPDKLMIDSHDMIQLGTH